MIESNGLPLIWPPALGDHPWLVRVASSPEVDLYSRAFNVSTGMGYVPGVQIRWDSPQSVMILHTASSAADLCDG